MALPRLRLFRVVKDDDCQTFLSSYQSVWFQIAYGILFFQFQVPSEERRNTERPTYYKLIGASDPSIVTMCG